MNHNEELPDFLGGLGDMLPADVLKMLNELLERVHRKDKDHQGSPVFIYAPGSQYVDKQFLFDKVTWKHHAPPDGYPAPKGSRNRRTFLSLPPEFKAGQLDPTNIINLKPKIMAKNKNDNKNKQRS